MARIAGLSVTKPIDGSATVTVTWNVTAPAGTNFYIFSTAGHGSDAVNWTPVAYTQSERATGTASGLQDSAVVSLTGVPTGTYDVMVVITNPAVSDLAPWSGGGDAVLDHMILPNELIISEPVEPNPEDFILDREDVYYAPGGESPCLNEHASNTGKSWKLTVNRRIVNRIHGSYPEEQLPRPCNARLIEWGLGEDWNFRYYAPTGKWYLLINPCVLEEVGVPQEYITGVFITPPTLRRGDPVIMSVDVKNIEGVVKNFMVNIMVRDSFGILRSISQNYWTGNMQPGEEKTITVDRTSPGYPLLRIPAFVDWGDLPITVSLYDGSNWMGEREFAGKLYVNIETNPGTVNVTGYGTCKGWSGDNYPVDKTKTFSTGDNLYAFVEFGGTGTVVRYVLTQQILGYLPVTSVYEYNSSGDPIGSHIGLYFYWAPPLIAGTWKLWSRVQESSGHWDWTATVS